MEELPGITIIMPCLNEEDYIRICLDSLIANNYPQEKMEVLTVDGMSEDRTRQIISEYSERYPHIRLVDNPKRFAPAALNIGIREAKGDIIVRIDSHTSYPRDYLRQCVAYILEYNADNVGGSLVVRPRANTLMGRAIAVTYSHYFGSGNADYKVGKLEKPSYVDTVPFGCFRRGLFDKIGYFNENLHRSQDMEFNKRLRKAGGKILLIPDVVSYYYIRSDLKSYFAHNYLDGKWAVYPYIFVKEPVSLRHMIPLLFVAGGLTLLIGSISLKIFRYLFCWAAGIYSTINSLFSFQISYREKNLALAPFCFVAFFVRHVAYGFGSLFALPKTISSSGFWKNRLKNGIELSIKNLGSEVSPDG